MSQLSQLSSDSSSTLNKAVEPLLSADMTSKGAENSNHASDTVHRFNLSAEPRGRRTFSGRIRVLSLSAIGEIDGFVLEDGSFVQIPPYAWIDGLNIRVGDLVAGEGEIKLEKPHGVLTQATLFKSENLVADGNLPEALRLDLQERHRHAQNDMTQKLGNELAHQKLSDAEGTLMAVGLRATAEVDRLILENRTSIHIPPSMTLMLGDVEIGEFLRVRGRVVTFADGVFVLAQRITLENGEMIR